MVDAYTYAGPTDGVFDAVSEIRYLLGDTRPKAPFSLSDGEIQYELRDGVSPSHAAANAAFQMAVRYLSESATSKSVGDLSISRDYAAVAGRLEKLARQLRTGQTAGGVPSLLFTSMGDPQFSLGRFDNVE